MRGCIHVFYALWTYHLYVARSRLLSSDFSSIILLWEDEMLSHLIKDSISADWRPDSQLPNFLHIADKHHWEKAAKKWPNIRHGVQSKPEISVHYQKFKLFKGTQDWEFFWLRFWILYYYIVGYVQILRFCKKKFWIGPLLEEIRLFRLVWD